MSPVRFEQPYDAALARDGSAFFATDLGRELEHAEMGVLRQLLDDCFGARALLLGAGSDERLLDALQVQRRVVARIADIDVPRRSPISATSATVTDPGNLPFANESFDVVILFHALDLAARPHQALREATRVLTEDGRLVVTGFNPWSLWGVRRLFGRRRAPWNAHFINPVRMGDWLSLLDFKVSATEFTRYRPPVTGVRRLFDARTPQALKRFVRMPFGGVWVMKARRHSARAVSPPSMVQRVPTRATVSAATGPAAASSARRPLPGTGNVIPFASAHDREH